MTACLILLVSCVPLAVVVYWFLTAEPGGRAGPGAWSSTP